MFWEEKFSACLQVLTLLRDLCPLSFASSFPKDTHGRNESMSLRCGSHLSQVCFCRRQSQVPQNHVNSEDTSAPLLLNVRSFNGSLKKARMRWGCDTLLSMKWHGRKYDCPTAILLYEICLSLLSGQSQRPLIYNKT